MSTGAQRSTFEGGSGQLTALVGRRAECARLAEALGRLRQGEGGAVEIVGPYGIGKSRLAEELACEGAERGLGCHVAFCAEGDAALRPLLALVEHLAGSVGGLDTLARDLRWTPAEARRVGAAVRGLSGAEDAPDGERGRQELHQGLRKVFLAPATTSPRALVLEDFERADEATASLVHDVVGSIEDHPTLLVLARRDAGVLRRQRGVAVLSLGPLESADATTLIEAVLHVESLGAGVLQALLDRVGGNPGLLFQILGTWIASGALVRDGDRWRSSTIHAEIPIPSSGADAALERLRSLPDSARAGLQLASVLGRTFPVELFDAAARTSRIGSADAVELRRLGLLVASGSVLSLTDALVGEVARAAMTADRRGEVYRAAAAALEGGGASDPGLVAALWLETDDPGRSVPWLVAAGHAARASFDLPSAASTWRRALEVARAVGRAEATDPGLWEALGEALLLQGSYPGAEEAYLASMALGSHDDDESARRLGRLAVIAQKAGRYEESLAHCRRAIALARRPTLAAGLEALAALTASYTGDLAGAERWIEAGLGRLDGLADRGRERAAVEAALHRAQGNVLLDAGRPLEAAAEFRRGLAPCLEAEDRWELSIALFNLGLAFFEADRLAHALHFLARALEEKEAIGDSWGLAWTHDLLARAHAALGRLDDARREAAAAARLATRDPKIAARVATTQAGLAHAEGDPERAIRLAGEASRTASEAGAVAEVVSAGILVAQIELERGELEAARGRAAAARRRAEEAGAILLSGRAANLEAEACLRLGRREEARASFLEALRSAIDADHRQLKAWAVTGLRRSVGDPP